MLRMESDGVFWLASIIFSKSHSFDKLGNGTTRFNRVFMGVSNLLEQTTQLFKLSKSEETVGFFAASPFVVINIKFKHSPSQFSL